MRDKKAIEYRLNAWVTDERVTVEAKGQDTVEIPNYTKWLFTSNDTVPVLVQPGDRRFSVIHSPLHLIDLNGQPGSNPTLPERFVAALDDPAFVQDVADYLLAVDLTAFRPFTPRNNASRDAVQVSGLSGCQRFWSEHLPPAGTFPQRAVYAVYQGWCADNGEKVQSMATLVRNRPDSVQPVTLRRDAVSMHLRAYVGQGDSVHCVRVGDVGQGGHPGRWPQCVLTPNAEAVTDTGLPGLVFTFPGPAATDPAGE